MNTTRYRPERKKESQKRKMEIQEIKIKEIFKEIKITYEKGTEKI